MSELDAGVLGDVVRLRRGRRTGRLSSWDQSGRNQDCWMVGAGDEVTLADLEGPGRLTHIWMTQASKVVLGPSMVKPDLAGVGNLGVEPVMGIHWELMDPDFYRKILLKIYWDDQPTPSVLAPIGDFFGLMNSLTGNLESLPLSVVAEDTQVHRFGGAAALSSFFQMPFNRRARVVLENQSDRPYVQYFYIDYELHDRPFPEDVAYFHAHWRRSAPTPGWAPHLQVNSPETNVPNLTGDGNYVVLDVEGEGHYVGCVLAVVHHQGTYPGEGDDMIFVDGEPGIEVADAGRRHQLASAAGAPLIEPRPESRPGANDAWPPTLHGTGTEDYFNTAWCPTQEQSAPYHGVIAGGGPNWTDPVTLYRFHIEDPVVFRRCIRVTIEHGHANRRADELSSTAFWYQAEPHGPFPPLPPVAERLPAFRRPFEERP